MKKNEVKIGETYLAKVTGKVVPVRIFRENPRGGWDAINTKTRRTVRVKSAQRLRKRLDDVASVANTPEAATKDATTTPERDTGERSATGGEPGGKKMSLLDAAAHLLSLGTGDAMRCKDIVDLAVARELWTPGNGKTPSNTLYASILREIKTKGDASRFVKAERGKFALASKA
jgi:hypothetical protein